MEKTYYKKVYGDQNESAIQKTTVGGICAAMHSWMTGDWGKTGFVRQEEIDWQSYTNSVWGSVFTTEDFDTDPHFTKVEQ
jgi:saccharopine dehydrogenase-like NADP-dependent oxidoreductase